MSPLLAATTVMNVTKDRSIEDHPFVVNLSAHAPLDREDYKALARVLKSRIGRVHV